MSKTDQHSNDTTPTTGIDWNALPEDEFADRLFEVLEAQPAQ